ncbi:MAG TPA: hypothetical protein PKH89_08135 [Anaerolineae bacterium]|nr:hypothetical protein [Anaerolineae bacterium]
MRRLGKVLLLFAALLWISVGCTGQPTPARNQPPTVEAPPVAEGKPTAAIAAPAYRVLRVLPVSQVTRNDEYYFDNCSPSSPAARSFSVAARVAETVTIADQATELTGSATVPIPAAIKDELAEAVRQAYSSELDAAVSKVSETTLYINAHDRYNLVIIWEERVYASTVTFSMDGIAYTAEYKYLLEVPRPGSIKPGICTP